MHRHIEAQLHGTTKEFDQLLSHDLPALNDSLKSKGQQPIPAPPVKVAGSEKALNLGGSNTGANLLKDFGLLPDSAAAEQ